MSDKEKDQKFRVAGWVTEETYGLMETVKEEYRSVQGLKLSQGMLIDLAFKALERERLK